MQIASLYCIDDLRNRRNLNSSPDKHEIITKFHVDVFIYNKNYLIWRI